MSFGEHFQDEYPNKEYLFVFIWTSANNGIFITYICVRGKNNVLFMPASNIHDFGFGNIESHY